MKPKTVFSLPDWIDPELWEAFEEMRNKLKKPMTNYAKKLIVAELVRLRDQGNDPEDCLKKSIRNGWLDVYPAKAEQAEEPRRPSYWDKQL